jgi:predicted GH43/DUF377 family glycosyl hydrolase
VLAANMQESWEAAAVFNGCPVKKGKHTFLIYRALSIPHFHSVANISMMVSDIGIAQSTDGVHFSNRKRFIVSKEPWERFGCEDPRVTLLNGTYYIFYTALSTYPFSPEGIKVGVAMSRDLKKIDERHPVTPFNAKAMTLFPERIGGKMWALLTVNPDRPPSRICLASFDRPEDIWSESRWNTWYADFEKHALPLLRSGDDQVEVGAPPLKTKDGWLVLYSYIRNYHSPQPLFSIEAVLLDLEDPTKVISRTNWPILTPEEYYEKHGLAPNIVFPSGAILDGDTIHLYYGAADTTVCLVDIKLSSLLNYMEDTRAPVVRLLRAPENPVITPREDHPWEKKATFNPAALYLDKKVRILYRAQGDDNTSVLGYAESPDGVAITYRSDEPVYVPREPFEAKRTPGGNSGCEDPRLTLLGGRVYLTYTAYDGLNPPRVALSSISKNDFVKRLWNWEKPILISPPHIDDKDACLFPEKVGGRFTIIHRTTDNIDLSFTDTLDFNDRWWLEEHRWIMPRAGWWDGKKIGAAAPPILTAQGWILLYHGVGIDSIYRVGAILLDRADPHKVIARTDHPLFEPEMSYEIHGQVQNVVFPCGAAIIKNTLFVYYGGADSVVGVATVPVKNLLRMLLKDKV